VDATRESPAPSGVVVTYDSASIAEARAVIAHGIERRVPLLTLTGKLGSGTSAVLRSLYQRFAEQCDLALPAEPPATVTELTVPVLRLLGRPFVDAPAAEVLGTIRSALDARAASPRPLALLLDDAESLPDDVLEALGAFGSPDGSERALLPIVLAGRPGLLARLSARKLATLRRGLTIDVRLHTPAPVAQAAPLAPVSRAQPPRRTGRPRTVVLATLCGCLSGAAALYLEQARDDLAWRPVVQEGFPMIGLRPSALAAIVVPRPAAPASPPPVLPPAHAPIPDDAREVVEAFHRAIAAGDGEAIRSLLTPDVLYNGVVGIDAAIDDQVWLGRGGDRPTFQAPDAVRPENGTMRVESPFSVPFRDVAGMRGEVVGRAVWHVAERAGRLRIVQVEYDVVPAPPPARHGG
jgi:hypothetical protein